MIHTVFYICSVVYFLKQYFVENFNPVGQEFANLVIFGLIIILINTRKNK